ncbi:MAG TPA: hypothetical protein VGM51_05765 [Armatimonadota bacterium]
MKQRHFPTGMVVAASSPPSGAKRRPTGAERQPTGVERRPSGRWSARTPANRRGAPAKRLVVGEDADPTRVLSLSGRNAYT